MGPEVLACMWIQAFLPVLGQNHLAVTDKLPDLLSEERTRFLQASLESGDCEAGFAKHPSTLTVSMLAVFSIKTRAEGKQLSGRSQRFWPEI